MKDFLEILRALLGSLSVIAVAVGSWWCLAKAAPFFLDSRFGPEGVDVVLFGCLVLFRVERQNIREAIIVKRIGLLRTRLANPDYESMMAISAVTRWQDTGVVIKTTGIMWWYFSPKDPDAAVAALHCPHHHG